VRFVTFLKAVLLTAGIGLLAVTYGIRTVRSYRSDSRMVVEQSCESKADQQEAEGVPAPPPDKQVGCWSELDSNLHWESIGQ
jgi:hypothetical protein